ncbi:unnamed protein product [Lota lota]
MGPSGFETPAGLKPRRPQQASIDAYSPQWTVAVSRLIHGPDGEGLRCSPLRVGNTGGWCEGSSASLSQLTRRTSTC